jgi:hypothetical protein
LAAACAGLAGADSNDDKARSGKPSAPQTIVCLELPRPDRLIDLLTDRRTADYLKLLPQYQKFASSKQFGELRAVVNVIAAQMNTTWDQGLRDLTGGGIVVALEAGPGQMPRPCAVVTAKKPEMLDRASAVLLDLARKDAKQKGTPDPVKTSAHHGVVINSIGGEAGVSYAIAQGRLFLAGSSQALARLLDRATGTPNDAGDRREASLAALVDRPHWQRLRDKRDPDALAWGFADLARLRELDPKQFQLKEKPDPPVTLLFGAWHEALKAGWAIVASLRWSDSELGATVVVPAPKQGRSPAFQGYVPPPGKGAGPLIEPPGTIASLSLWRDWPAIWESKNDLFAPETAQGFAQLDTLAGQFFGVREFGPDVLGSFEPQWRIVVARQDYARLKPAPDVKLPAFALVTELKEPGSDFAQRLKVAFQTFIGISNVEAVQKKAPPFELGSEQVEGVTLATARYMIPRSTRPDGETPNQRYNYTPSAAQAGKYFIVSSSAELARSLIKLLKSDAWRTRGSPAPATAVLEADGPELARLLELNRGRLAIPLMLDGGQTRAAAERQVALGLSLLRRLGRGRLTIKDEPAATSLELRFALSRESARRSRP